MRRRRKDHVMAGDYGERRKLKTAWMFPTLVIGLAVLAALLAAVMLVSGLRAQSAADQYWKVTGSPCPRLTRQAFESQAIKPTQSFRMESVVFARAYGYSSCGELPAKGGLEALVVCQFTNPGVLAVTTAAGDFYFAPGVGQPATVSAGSDAPSCVMGSNYKGD
jgi:hypothetical protein